MLPRDKGLCQECLRNNRVTPATNVDHIVLKSQGGPDDESNLQSLCHHCHMQKSYLEGVGKYR